MRKFIVLTLVGSFCLTTYHLYGLPPIDPLPSQTEINLDILQDVYIPTYSQEVTTPSAPDPVDLNELELYKANLEKLLIKIDSTKPTGSVSEQQLQYLTLESELDQLEDAIDYFEHMIKTAYKSGQLPLGQYKSIKSQVNALENQLDLAEDTLDFKFGIND